jgi:hypothetical protein
MRTVFVPYVLLPEKNGNLDYDDVLDERERREAGNDERTVILCVEVENSGESGPGVGFCVEAVDIKVGGEGARTALIGWGEHGTAEKAEHGTFPLLVGPTEQYNLLYAVFFLRSPNDTDALALNKRDSIVSALGGPLTNDLQRAVAITIHGKPYLPTQGTSLEDVRSPMTRKSVSATTLSELISYPTNTFSSRWNCVLDLSTQSNPLELQDDYGAGNRNALPEPASPFSTYGMRTSSAIAVNSAFPTPSPLMAVAGSKLHTLGEYASKRMTMSSTPTYYQAPPSAFLNPNGHNARERLPPTPSKLSTTPPIVNFPPTPTTYAPPPSIESDDVGNATPNLTVQSPYSKPFITPAYPAYPSYSAIPPTPFSIAPIADPLGGVGPSVEIRRERGMAMGSTVPQTPGPTISTGFGEQGAIRVLQQVEESGQSIVVSVGLLPQPAKAHTGEEAARDRIRPLDQFTLDIFVFNKSPGTRRFEVSCPDRRHRRRQDERNDVSGMDGSHHTKLFTGILPLHNRVRIG